MRRLSGFARSGVARLLVGYLFIAVIFAVAWLWSLYGPLEDAVIEQHQRTLRALAQATAVVTAESTHTPQSIARQLVARTDVRITMVSPDGTVLVDTDVDPKSMENHGDRPEIKTALAGAVGFDRRTSRTEGNEQLYVAVPGTLDGHLIAVRVSEPIAKVEQVAVTSRRLGLVLIALAGLLTMVVALRMARLAAEPIQLLTQSAEEMATGNLTAPIPRVTRDLEPLADSLVTLRQQMRSRLEALEAEKQTLRSAIDGLTDAVFVLDDSKITLANAAAGDLFRQPYGGWPGTEFSDSGLPGGLIAATLTHLKSGAPQAVDIDTDPAGRTLRLVVSPLQTEAGSTSRSIVVVRDVSERARLDAIRRDFVANASHELKTPVAGIRLLAESVEAAAGHGDVEQALGFAHQIESETLRLQRLVSDLLDLSRLEAIDASDEITDVKLAVDKAMISHRGPAGRKNLTLGADLAAVELEDLYVAVNATDMAIALDNLLDNAIAYTDSGTVMLRVSGDSDQAVIAVTDSGPGIAAEHLPRIFERFYRVDRGRSRDAGGTGLGLALVRHVVEKAGGSVAVDSTPGKGSTFTIRLPRAY